MSEQATILKEVMAQENEAKLAREENWGSGRSRKFSHYVKARQSRVKPSSRAGSDRRPSSENMPHAATDGSETEAHGSFKDHTDPTAVCQQLAQTYGFNPDEYKRALEDMVETQAAQINKYLQSHESTLQRAGTHGTQSVYQGAVTVATEARRKMSFYKKDSAKGV